MYIDYSWMNRGIPLFQIDPWFIKGFKSVFVILVVVDILKQKEKGPIITDSTFMEAC